MFNKTLIIALACLSLTVGCGFTKEGDLVRRAVSREGAKAMDEGVNNTVWALCFGFSHGAIERKFGATKDMSDAYNTICGRSGNSVLGGNQAIVTGVPEATVSE